MGKPDYFIGIHFGQSVTLGEAPGDTRVAAPYASQERMRRRVERSGVDLLRAIAGLEKIDFAENVIVEMRLVVSSGSLTVYKFKIPVSQLPSPGESFMTDEKVIGSWRVLTDNIPILTFRMFLH